MTNPPSFAFRAPPLIRIGWGSLRDNLAETLTEIGIARPMLVIDPVIDRLASVVDSLEALATTVRFAARFDDIPGEPTTREVLAGVAVMR